MGGEVSPAVDIHALGVLAEKIVTQKECLHSWGGISASRRLPRSGLYERCVLAASSWRRIIRRATSSIPSERYPSVDSFAAAIRRRHWPVYMIVIGIILIATLVGTLATVGRDLRARRNPDKTQSALNVDFESLEENTLLNGATKVYRRPIFLASNRTYRITGPGTLDADISGPTNSLVALKNCVLINRTREAYPKNGVRYRLDNGVYLNFINQKERSQRFWQFILPYDGAYNEVRFGGPATLKELYRLRNKEGMNRIRRE